jgi:hypothetical protein
MTTRAKHVLFVVGLLFVVLLVGALVGAYMISRDPGFAFENPNAFEANRFVTKLRRYENARTNGHQGFVRFSQAEINSYIRQTMTNIPASREGSSLRLRRVGIGLSNTNLTLFTWGQCSFLKLPLKFCVQRGYRIEQNGTNQWEMPLESFKVGEVEVPRRYWDSAAAFFKPLDQPALDSFPWRTNVPALLVRKNEISDRPELRLYTYKPIPPEDLR